MRCRPDGRARPCSRCGATAAARGLGSASGNAGAASRRDTAKRRSLARLQGEIRERGRTGRGHRQRHDQPQRGPRLRSPAGGRRGGSIDLRAHLGLDACQSRGTQRRAPGLALGARPSSRGRRHERCGRWRHPGCLGFGGGGRSVVGRGVSGREPPNCSRSRAPARPVEIIERADPVAGRGRLCGGGQAGRTDRKSVLLYLSRLRPPRPGGARVRLGGTGPKRAAPHRGEPVRRAQAPGRVDFP